MKISIRFHPLETGGEFSSVSALKVYGDLLVRQHKIIMKYYFPVSRRQKEKKTSIHFLSFHNGISLTEHHHPMTPVIRPPRSCGDIRSVAATRDC